MPRAILGLLFVLSGVFEASAYDPKQVHLPADQLPQALENAGIKERLGENVDLNLRFTDERGESVAISDFFKKDRPVILSLIYYSCPNLCNFHLNGLNDAMRKLKWTVGDEYQVIAVSFDHKESAELAKAKKESYLQAYGRPAADKGWHFLTGDEASIAKLAQSVGFSFAWNEETKEWAHSSAAILLTPEGKISRYLHGVHFEEKDLRLALLETAEGKIGTVIERIVLYCFRFDPKKNKYTLYAYNVMKAGATATVFLMGLFLVPVWMRERRSSNDGGSCCSGPHNS